MQATRLMYDEKRGWYEGRVEATGDYNRSLTLSTNATVLEALFYKANGGPLLASDAPAPGSYFSRRLSDVFNPCASACGESRRRFAHDALSGSVRRKLQPVVSGRR